MRVPDLMIGFLLAAAHITTCLNYSHSFIALSLFHIFNNLVHTNPLSISSSLHLQLLTPGTLNATVGTHSLHSQLHSAIRHASLADYRRLLKHFSAVLPELHWFPYCQNTILTNLSLPYAVSNTITLGVLRTLTNTD
jgi:hypothetical protein